ncbi:uncharacterized protein LOC125842813 [Solanum stenotomum]|uniref:uncharacterized protein LOC125842813 n=1 Tax=Solanum stenotomum TaxID=172797 RepID=UPI0020CFFED2|nr:uncharacterized protein LOC125842813 [Solanum stenotomum]
MDTSAEEFDGSNQDNMGFDKKTEELFRLLKEVERELYPGSKYSLHSFLVRLLHLKRLNGWSNKSFSMLLELLKDVLPEGETLPKSFYDSKKIIKDLGLEYKKIHACPNDCMIYWNETKDRTSCKFCKALRYKQFKGASVNSSSETSNIPSKVFRYFPLIPRLQRLFMSAKASNQMRWHVEGHTRDGVMRHPADGIAWRKFDEAHTDFARDPQNVRLGLASDGFSPLSMSISHSTWPVILIPYNLPPWLCMKQPYMILSTIIDGPHAPDGAPKRLTGIEILKQLNNVKNKFGKDLLAKSRKRKWDDVDNLVQNIWNKKSIFFGLEYWKDNMIRHNLDTMHIEKNVFDNIFWTIIEC